MRGENMDAFEQAVSRVDHRLIYGRTEKPRTWKREELEGPDIPDAFHEGKLSPGAWLQQIQISRDEEEFSQEDWLAHFLSMAVNEAVHEVLEYFRVDGRPYLNPHGQCEEEIYILVNELAAELAGLAERGKK
jgi:hypothetical protein